MNQRRVEFLRVMIAAAWADGELTIDELNTLKTYFRQLELTDDEYAALEPYLADPIGPDEARTIVDDFLAEARRPERGAVVAAIRDLLLVDGELSENGEKQFLELVAESVDNTSSINMFVDRLKKLWRSAPVDDDRTPFRRADLLDDFTRNRVLYQVKRRLYEHGTAEQLDPDAERQLRYICAVAALLARVANADHEVKAIERQRIGDALDLLSALRRPDVDVIVSIVNDEVLKGLDYVLFARELNEIGTHDDQLRLLELLFAIAAADDDLSFEETEEIRKLSIALKLTHDEFVAAKQAAAERLAERLRTQ